MAFTGKATYTAGAGLPEIAEDVSEVVGMVSPVETPLLDALGVASRVARSTVHEWLEETPLVDTFNIRTDISSTEFEIDPPVPFAVGDLIMLEGSSEVLRVNVVADDVVVVARGYGGTPQTAQLSPGRAGHRLARPVLEGADAGDALNMLRARKSNYTQIFSGTVEVSGSELAVRQIGVKDELEYLKAMRLKALLHDLEKSVINGVISATAPQGSESVARTMRGVIPSITSNVFTPGTSGFPAGTTLGEEQLNLALRQIWSRGQANVDLIVVGGKQKRAINQFIASSRRFYSQTESYKDLVSTYESDFGVCRVVLSRYVPAGTALLLDSSRIEVLPLSGRSFHYKSLASTGDREGGQLIGEYTLEFRNEQCHGVIKGLAT